ncbi:MAG TPA: glutaredoxin 3 [Bdellovibrionota bacterium]|nr:glutaredoxin 3 [Bdellovibrionota bacterium]
MKVTIYTTDYCGYCRLAKSLLQSKGIKFTEIDVTNDEKMRKKLVEITGKKTVPQIFFGEKPIGGYDNLVELEKKGELDQFAKKPTS